MLSSRYTYTDYLTWPAHPRYELINGIAYAMAPAPSTRHQKVADNFLVALSIALKGKRCTPFSAPTDVKLSDHDVVQPDVLVVCDPAKITASHIDGAPDLVVEVLSPATAAKDLREKKALYQRAGVREYVVVDPLENYVQGFALNADGHYGAAEIYGPQEIVTVLDGVTIELWEIFEVAPPESAPPNAAG